MLLLLLRCRGPLLDAIYIANLIIRDDCPYTNDFVEGVREVGQYGNCTIQNAVHYLSASAFFRACSGFPFSGVCYPKPTHRPPPSAGLCTFLSTYSCGSHGEPQPHQQPGNDPLLCLGQRSRDALLPLHRCVGSA